MRPPGRSNRIPGCLATLALFRDLDRNEILRIAAGTEEIVAPKNTVLFRRGDPCTGFHIVISGQVKLSLQTTRGSERVIEILGKGQSFGEAVMFVEKPYMVTAETLADSRLLHIAGKAIFAELDRDPLLSRRIIAGLSMRLHHLVNDLESCTLQSGTHRVIDYLLSLAGESAADSMRIDLPARKNVIASRLNLTQEHFSRTLHALAAAGLISVDGQSIKIPDIERLKTYSDRPDGKNSQPPA